MRLPVFAVCLLLGAASAAAQDTSIVIHPESSGVNIAPGQLPRLVAEEVVRFYNAATTSRLVGRTLLPKGNEWRGAGAPGHRPGLGARRGPGSPAPLKPPPLPPGGPRGHGHRPRARAHPPR